MASLMNSMVSRTAAQRRHAGILLMSVRELGFADSQRRRTLGMMASNRSWPAAVVLPRFRACR